MARRSVRHATIPGERCDLCTLWHPLSMGRVMGWCMLKGRPPDMPLAWSLLVDQISAEALTTYNDVCPSFHTSKETPQS